MGLTRNHITYSGTFGKIDPRIQFKYFQNRPNSDLNRPWAIFPKLPTKSYDY